MIPVTRRAVEDLPSWPLVEPQDLFTALTELKRDHGWDGSLDTASWKVCFSKSGKNSVNAELGQWLVIDGDLRAIYPAAFGESYDTPETVVFPEPEPEPEPVPEPEPQSSPDTFVPVSRTVR